MGFRYIFSNSAEGHEIVVYDQKSAASLEKLVKPGPKSAWKLRVVCASGGGATPSNRGAANAADGSLEGPVGSSGKSVVPPRFNHRAEKQAERRAHARHSARFRIVVVAGSKTFRTFTQDISLGGIRLEKPLPISLEDRKCEILIGSADSRENIRFKCVIVSDPREQKRMCFVDIEEISAKRLEKWIATTAGQGHSSQGRSSSPTKSIPPRPRRNAA